MKIIGKIFLVLLIVIIVLIIAGVIMMTVLTKSNDGYKGNFTKVLKSSDSNAPKALVVYQPTFTDGAEKVANKLAEGLNKEGYEVTITYPGKHVSSDTKMYSIVSFGSPVYFGKPSAIVNDAILSLKGSTDQKTILYSVGGNTDAPELDVLKKSFGDKEPNYTTKFIVSDSEKENKAYELGVKAAKESKGSK